MFFVSVNVLYFQGRLLRKAIILPGQCYSDM